MNIYETIHQAIIEQLKAWRDETNTDYSDIIELTSILNENTNPTQLKDDLLPAIAVTYGGRTLNNNITATVNYRGENVRYLLYLTVNKKNPIDPNNPNDKDGSALKRALKAESVMDKIIKSLRNPIQIDGANVQNCILQMSDTFIGTLSEREFIRYNLLFDIIIQND